MKNLFSVGQVILMSNNCAIDWSNRECIIENIGKYGISLKQLLNGQTGYLYFSSVEKCIVLDEKVKRAQTTLSLFTE